MSEKPENRFYVFDEFRLDRNEHTLFRNDEKIPLTHKAIELLTALIDRRGETITKAELMDSLWRDTYVDENNLAVTVMMLRKAFSETAADKKFIETVPKRGYRFVAPVEITNADLLIEKQTRTRITIDESQQRSLQGVILRPATVAVVITAVIGTALLFYVLFRKDSVGAPRTLAVLPVKSIGDSMDEDLALGLTDAMITRLGGLRGLAIRPTSAVLSFDGDAPLSSTAIGERLKVESVLETSLQRSGDQMRAQIRLVRTSDGTVMWSQSIDSSVGDVFGFQDRIAEQIGDALKVRLSGDERRQVARRPTEDIEAYKLYLRGRHAWNKRSIEGLGQSIQLFNQAIDRDPTFALAYAGLADSYALLSNYNVRPPKESYPKARASALRALEIEPDLAEAGAVLADALVSYDWNFTDGEAAYRSAIAAKPNYATAHQWYAEFLSEMGRHREALDEIRRAKDLDPLSPLIASVEGMLLYMAGDHDGSVTSLRQAIRDHPDYALSYAYIALPLAQQNKFDEAFEAETNALRLAGVGEEGIESLRQAYQRSGWNGFLQAMLAGTDAEAQKHYVNPFSQALLYMRLRDRVKAMEWL